MPMVSKIYYIPGKALTVVPTVPKLLGKYIPGYVSRQHLSANLTVGRTHTIVRFQTRIRRKDGTENFGGFVYVLDGCPQRDFVLWVFMCPINISRF